MIRAYIKAVEYYFPENYEENSIDDKLTSKIGIKKRNIAKNEEFASDLAVAAALKLFDEKVIDRNEIDFLILCTQSPDYLLPSTSCIIQDRLGLPTTCGAFDFNLGCSGFVYGLSIAKGLIESGSAKNILLLTADTYSKYINPLDRSVRVLFGDAASATLISSKHSSEELIGPFVFGTDGSGKDNLIVHAGGLREPLTNENQINETDEYSNTRSRANLYMNGPEIFNFTLKEVPKSFNALLEKSKLTLDDYDKFIFHQANKFMLEHLRKKVGIDEKKFPIFVESCGNTVSSTIPIVIKNELINKNIVSGNRIMLLGFGVGYSWAACNIIWN